MQNTRNSIFAFFCIVIMLITNSLFAQFAGGTGTELDPWQISTPAQLAEVNNYLTSAHSDKHFKLINDIDVSTYISEGNPGYHNGYGWYPLGRRQSPLFGKFDGAGHTVSGVNIDGTKAPNAAYEIDLGFFGETGDTFVLKNLTVEASFVIGMTNIGGMVGLNAGYIVNCRVIMLNDGMVGYPPFNLITGVGGFVGWNKGTISKCSFSGGVIGKWRVGGFAGFHGSGIIKDCYATGKVLCVENIGGFTGICNSPIVNCYASVNMEWDPQTLYKGGFGGNQFNNNYYTGCYWNKELSNLATSPGSDPSFGKTTDQMKLQTTFANWDFTNTWQISRAVNGGLPTLRPNNAPLSTEVSTTISTNAEYTILLTDFSYNDPDGDAFNRIEITSLAFNGSLALNGTPVVLNQEILCSSISNGQLIFTPTNGVSGLDAANFNYKVSDGMDYSGVYTKKFNMEQYFAGGSGSVADPFRVTTAEQLNFVHLFMSANRYFKQMNDIDLSGFPANNTAGWLPIGDQTNSFRGKYDGQGFIISNLNINRPALNNCGLFGYTGLGAVISKVVLKNAVVIGGSSTGALVGTNRSGEINDCGSINGNVTGGNGNSVVCIGGLVGLNCGEGSNFSYIRRSFSNGTVSCTTGKTLGGLVGQNGESTALNGQVIENCHSSAIVHGSNTVQEVGGLIGRLDKYGWVMNSYSTGKVSGNLSVGGFFGIMASDFNRSNNNYWDSETSETTIDGGYNGTFEAGTNSTPPQGRNSVQMKNQLNYTNWDFSSVWSINLTNYGYPFLKWQTVEVTPAITTFPWVEAFEDDSPTKAQWSQRQISGNIHWYFTGSQGYNESNNCAELEHDNSSDGSIARLITPLFNFTGLVNPKVRFYYTQGNWSGDINALKVYYKNDFSDNWTQFFYDNTAKDNWTECILDLPSPSAYYQIAFEGIDNFGWPSLIDDVELYGDLPSSIDNKLLPLETQLYNNYPNPFNPTTTIKFDLKSTGITKLVVYNAKGELVKTLINSMQNAGRYSVNFDATGYNSGVYFYKLDADRKSIVKKMIMVK